MEVQKSFEVGLIGKYKAHSKGSLFLEDMGDISILRREGTEPICHRF